MKSGTHSTAALAFLIVFAGFYFHGISAYARTPEEDKCTQMGVDRATAAWDFCLNDQRQLRSAREASANMLPEAVVGTWIADLEVNGWTFLANNDDIFAFWKPAPGGGATRQIWVRDEFKSPQSSPNAFGASYLSSVTLYEVNCPNLRNRSLQQTVYTGRNLLGEPSSFSSASNWSYAIPGSFGEAIQRQACSPRSPRGPSPRRHH